MVMPAGVPTPILSRLSSEIEKILNTQDVKDRFSTLGANVLFMTPEHYAEYVRAEIKKWSVVVRETGMRVD